MKQHEEIEIRVQTSRRVESEAPKSLRKSFSNGTPMDVLCGINKDHRNTC
jgi:hypothetical protein